MKKIIAAVLGLIMLFICISACNVKEETSQSSKDNIEETITTEKQVEIETTNNVSTETTLKDETTNTQTTSKEEEVSLKDFYISDPIEKTFGSYLTIVYNESISDINVEVKKGLGAKEEYSITVTMKHGFAFMGYSFDGYMNSEKTTKKSISNNESCSFVLEEEKTLYCNYKMKVVYYGMGGLIDGKEVYEEDFDISTYRCPNTKPNKNNIIRDGYILVGYNTKEDMTGDRVGVGSKYNFNSSVGKLYCMWAKESDPSDFEYKKVGVGCTINKYTGTDEEVVVPSKIDGNKVTSIAANAFENTNIRHITLPLAMSQIKGEAFKNCANLEKITCYDSIILFEDSALYGCSSFKKLEINTSYDMYDWWGTGTYIKYDRLLWAKNMKKIVVFGGSGTWYGYDSVYLNEQFGDEYVIINLGTNASMTNLFIMEFLTYYMNEDDILIWSPECGAKPLGTTTMTDGSNASTEREFSFCAYNYDNIALLDISKYSKVFTNFAAYNQLHPSKTVSFEYSVKNINIYGDDVSPRVSEEKTYNYSYVSALSNKAMFKDMGDQILKMKEKGVKTLYSFTVSQKGCATDAVLEKYIKNIEEIFHVTSISDYHDLLFPYTDFHNSAWHLVNEAAHKRTVIVCEDLKNYLEKE